MSWTFISSAPEISEICRSSTNLYPTFLALFSSQKRALQIKPRKGYFFKVPGYPTYQFSSGTWLSQIKGI